MQLYWFVAISAALGGIAAGAFGSIAIAELRGKLTEGTFATARIATIVLLVSGAVSGFCITQANPIMAATGSPASAISIGGPLATATVILGTVLVLITRQETRGPARKVVAVLAALSGLAFSFASEYLYLGPSCTQLDGIMFPLACTVLALNGGMALHIAVLAYSDTKDEMLAITKPSMTVGALAATCVLVSVMVPDYIDTGMVAWGFGAIIGGMGPSTMSWLIGNGLNEINGKMSTPSLTALACAVIGCVSYRCFIWIVILGSEMAFFSGTV